MKHHNTIFVALAAIMFVALTIFFNFLPRSTFSELERRELADVPSFSVEKLFDGSWAQEVSAWYSDTEPFRDHFMYANMHIVGKMALAVNADGDVSLAFHAPDAPQQDVEDVDMPLVPDSINGYVNNINAAEENTKIAHSGILVVGTPPNARAMMAYGASGHAGTEFANLVNKYFDVFDGKVNVYAMVIPNSIEFYCPDKAKYITKPQSATINNIYKHLKEGVKGVDCYTPLSQHVDEDIFLRTDHHWAPRGAYYAAEAFAKAADVPFADLSTYDVHVVHDFVGTMYGYSRDIAVKQSPEDFVYYTPTGVDYETTYIVYNLDKNMHITSEGKPHKGQYFVRYGDGNGAAYCTFMGGDQKITQVRTDTNNGRRLLILKDSFGNAVPGYLFHSFEQIHVVDFRYFTRNLMAYVKECGITDILFAHSIFMCLGSRPISNYNRFLTQTGKIERPKPFVHADSTNTSARSKKLKSDDSPANVPDPQTLAPDQPANDAPEAHTNDVPGVDPNVTPPDNPAETSKDTL